MKAVVAAFNQEKALVGAFSVIVQFHRLIDLRHYYLPSTDLATDPSLSTKEDASRRSRESATQPPTR